MSILPVTGSCGLIGSECVGYFDAHGIDNNMRIDFFGHDGDTSANLDGCADAPDDFSVTVGLFVTGRRSCDYICYISSLAKMHSHFPSWRISRRLDQIIPGMCQAAFAG